MKNFGEIVREFRTKNRITLREFCRIGGKDASNWSKIERGEFPAPQDPGELAKIASILGIQRGTDDWNKLHDSASISRGKIPEDVLSDDEVLDILPVFFRTLRGKQHNEEELDNMIAFLRKR